MKKLFKILFIVLLIICAAGSLWQYFASEEELESLEMPGRLYSVDGHDVHLYASGDGNQTAVFVAGSGTYCAYTDFYGLQSALSGTMRTISYDRPGYGFSEPNEDLVQIDDMVENLNGLLEAAGEKGPYILIGHSLASLEVIRFAQTHPEKVKAIVLLDAGSPQYYAEVWQMKFLAMNRLAAAMRFCGIHRIMMKFDSVIPFYGAEYRLEKLDEPRVKTMERVMYYNKIGLGDNLPAIGNMNDNAKKVVDEGPLEGIPLLVLSSDSKNEKWNDAQRELLSWSDQSRQVTLKDSQHYVHWTNAEEVLQEMMHLADTLK
ncbi:MAG: alpha/beta hydrolase [Christensenellales bacterium]|jgi:pimeloyl-ACP methyl ester carboxylesterase